jgi:hypothetical protein
MMGNQTSILSDAVAPILAMLSHILDYFVAGNELTARGNFIAGSLTDIARSIAEFSTHLPVLLGNHV